MNQPLRVVAAAAAGVAVCVFLIFVFSLPISVLVNSLLPTSASGAETEVVNTAYAFPHLLWTVAACCGLLVALFVWDPQVSSSTEKLMVFSVYLPTILVSSFNFYFDDKLIPYTAQMILDFVLAASGLCVMIFLFQMKPVRVSSTVINRILILLIGFASFLMPLFYGTLFLMKQFGLDLTQAKISDWLEIVAGIFSLAMALAPSFINKNEPAS